MLNFVVVTKGARRISDVMQEFDFYGSMAGASKFVRGDAMLEL